MRLLHIADLHAGKTIGSTRRVSRNEDLEYALRQVESICKEEKVSVLLMAGDIFDKANPDHESEGLLLDFLTRMHHLGVHTVIISGNHDSYDLISNYKHLKKLARIHAFDRPSTDLSKSVFELRDLKVACLPYPSERVITSLDQDAHRDYKNKVEDYIRALAKQVEDARYRILLAHLMLESAQIAGTERQASVSQVYAIMPQRIPETFHYVALGHVHRHQSIKSAPTKTYYAGSLYQLDFSESGMEKFVNLVVFEDDQVKVQPISLDLKRQLIQVEVKNDVDYKALLNVNFGKDYVKLVYHADPRDIGYNTKKNRIMEALGENLITLEVKHASSSRSDAPSVQEKDLVDMYVDYYRRSSGGSDPPEELLSALKGVLEEAEHETH